jgi:hypothetical protein
MRSVLEKVVEKVLLYFWLNLFKGNKLRKLNKKCYNNVTFILDIGHSHMFSSKFSLFCLQL